MKRIFHYIAHPILYGEAPATVREKFRYAVDAIVFGLLAKLMIGFILGAERLAGGHVVKDLFASAKPVDMTQGLPLFLILLIVVVPVTEEIGFRGFLTRNLPFEVLSLSVLAVIFMNIIYLHTIEPWFALNGWIRLVFSSSLFLAMLRTLCPRREQVAKLIYTKRSAILAFSAVSFAAIHVFNYNLSSLGPLQKLCLPLLVIPYLGMAMALSYVRARCGLAWSIGLHIVNNLVAAVILLNTS